MRRRVFMLGLMCALFVSFMATDMVVADTAEAKKSTLSIATLKQFLWLCAIKIREKDG